MIEPGLASDSVLDLLSKAAEGGVALHAEGERIGYRCSHAPINPNLLNQLRIHKQELLAWLRQHDASDAANKSMPFFRQMPGQEWVPSFRRATWDGIKNGMIGVDSANRKVVVRVRGPLEFAAVEKALQMLTERHSVLTAKAVDRDGEPWLHYEQVGRSASVKFLDVTESCELGVQHPAFSLANELVWQPFAMEVALMRAFVIRLRADDHVFGLIVHHMIADRLSMELLFREFWECYGGESREPETTHPPLSIEYRDYLLVMAEWQRQPMAQAQLQYLTRRMADAPCMNLPVGPASPSRAGARQAINIDVQLAHAIREKALRMKVTSFLMLLAAQNILLYKLVGEDDIVVGGVTAGREHPALRATVGYMADRVYWRTSLKSNPSFREVVERTSASVLNVVKRQFVRSDFLGRSCLFHHQPLISAPVFNFQPLVVGRRRSAQGSLKSMLRIEPFPISAPPFSTGPSPGMCYWMELTETTRGMVGHVRYPGPAYPTLVECYLEVLRRGVADESAPLSSF